MKRVLIVFTSALLVSASAFAEQPSQPKDMLITGDALIQLGQQLNEVPFKYASPMLATLQKGLKPIPEPKPTEAPPDYEKK